MVQIATSSIAAIAAIVCAVISSLLAERQRASIKEADGYRKKREELDAAKSKVLLATMEGVIVLLRQAKGEKLNGNVEAALDNLDDAYGELKDIRSGILAGL